MLSADAALRADAGTRDAPAVVADAPRADGGTIDAGVVVGAPSAPRNVQAFATTRGVYVLFAPPSSAGGSAITRYTATTNTGQSAFTTATRIQNEGNTLSYNQLNCRVDIAGVPAGTPVTVTVTAANAQGTSPASAASNAVTPAAAATTFVARGAESPTWGDYSYGGHFYYDTAPGTPSRNGTGAIPAPANPVDASANVIEVDNANANAGLLPYFHHENPDNVQNGRLLLAPYSTLIVSVYPMADQASFQQGMFLDAAKCLWVNGAATAGGTSSLTDSTQSWPANIFVDALVTNITTGQTVNIASNTADTLTFNGSMTVAAGDLYEISVPDIGAGKEVVVGNGTATGWGPTKMVAGQWNTYAIPLTAFDAATGNYAQVSGDQILKFTIVLSASSTEVHYFSNIGFSP